jgi:hypothetical protein
VANNDNGFIFICNKYLKKKFVTELTYHKIKYTCRCGRSICIPQVYRRSVPVQKILMKLPGISYSPQHNYAQNKTNQPALSPANKSHVTLPICDTQHLATQCNIAHEDRLLQLRSTPGGYRECRVDSWLFCPQFYLFAPENC